MSGMDFPALMNFGETVAAFPPYNIRTVCPAGGSGGSPVPMLLLDMAAFRIIYEVTVYKLQVSVRQPSKIHRGLNDMRKKATLILLAFIAAAGFAGILLESCGNALDPAALRERSVYLAENVPLSSTANGAQEKTIRTLLADGAASGETADLTVEYPFDGAVFPPEIVPPMFIWSDENERSDTWLVSIAFAGGGGRISVLAPNNPPPPPAIDQACRDLSQEQHPPPDPFQPPATNWTPDPDLWSAIKELTKEKFATVTFYGFDSADPKKVLSRGSMTLMTSKDPVGAPIFYRDVPMIGVKRELDDEISGLIQPIPVNAQKLITWKLRDISRPEPKIVLKDIPTCANCHSFSADGSTMGMDVDGPAGDKGAYMIKNVAKVMEVQREDIISWNYSFEKKPEYEHKTIGFLSQMSPDGKYAMTTLNEQVFVSNYEAYEFIQVFYPTRGVLGYYSVETGEVSVLPGADDPEYVHCNAAWSPDGSWLAVTRAKARPSNVEGQPRPRYANDPNETQIQYDLVRIPFNGGRGGKAVPIKGASNNGMSNNYPKISPDGKWIVFVKCKNGQLMRPDSRLWIVPAEGGEAREMNCNTSLMNSWHSFSPNGRWLVFSSKSRTPYTRLFLTHIDENGIDTPPVLIPGCTAPNRAANIPEFVNIDYDDLNEITVPAIAYRIHHERAMELGDHGKFEEALEELKLALAEEPDDRMVAWDIHYKTAIVLERFGDFEGAVEHYKEAIGIEPTYADPYFSIAVLRAKQGRFQDAAEYFEKTVEVMPGHEKSWYYLAEIHFKNPDSPLYDPKEALRCARKASDLTYNREPLMLEMLAWTYAANGMYDKALETAESALEYARPRGIQDHIRRIEGIIEEYKKKAG